MPAVKGSAKDIIKKLPSNIATGSEWENSTNKKLIIVNSRLFDKQQVKQLITYIHPDAKILLVEGDVRSAIAIYESK